jgi:hypothetical protein
MKISLNSILITLTIFICGYFILAVLFLIVGWLFEGFFQFSISMIGMLEMLLFSLLYLKMLFTKPLIINLK